MRTKQELLDTIELCALSAGGEIVLASKVGLVKPDLLKIEELLGKIIDATLDLKEIEGIPSNLKRVERENESTGHQEAKGTH